MNIIRRLTLVVVCVTLASVVVGQVPAPTAPPTPPPLGQPIIPNLGQPAAPNPAQPTGPISFAGPFPATVPAPAAAAATTAAAAASNKPEIGIAEAAGTLTDPTDFIYLSKEFVFNLFVLASAVNTPGVSFNPDALPQVSLVDSNEGAGTAQGSPSGSRSGSRTGSLSSGEGEGSYYRSRPVNRAEQRAGDRPSYRSKSVGGGQTETAWVGSSTEGGRRTVGAAQYLSGQPEQGRTYAAPTEDSDSGKMLDAITVTNNPELAKLKELVKALPTWQRVGRFPLLTTQKQKIDKAIAGVYAQAFRVAGTPQTQYNYGSGYYEGGSYQNSGTWQVNLNTPGRSPTGEAGSQPAPPYPGQAAYPGQGPQGPPPIDPQAMGEWYYYYQQTMGWERYVAEEVLMLKEGEPQNMYDLGTAVQAQDLYVPQPMGQNAPPPLIHFDNKEKLLDERLSLIKPAGMKPALEQMDRQMAELAAKNARDDSNRNREFVARLEARKQRRFLYREWLNDQTAEIRKMAEDYRRRMAGDQFEIDGVRFLVSEKPLNYVPLNARNIVTERLTPYDLLDNDGALKKPTEETSRKAP